MARNSKERVQKTMWDNGQALISLRKTIKSVTAQMPKQPVAAATQEKPTRTALRKKQD